MVKRKMMSGVETVVDAMEREFRERFPAAKVQELKRVIVEEDIDVEVFRSMTEEDVAQVFAGFSWAIRRALAMTSNMMFAKMGNEMGEVEEGNLE